MADELKSGASGAGSSGSGSKFKAKSPLERELQNNFRIWCTERIPGIRIFVRSVGVFELEDGRVFRAGLKGQSDLYALVKGGGHVELEVKSLKGKLSVEQERWRAFCGTWGVPYLLLQPVKNETMSQTLERWIGELRAVVNAASGSQGNAIAG